MSDLNKKQNSLNIKELFILLPLVVFCWNFFGFKFESILLLGIGFLWRWTEENEQLIFFENRVGYKLSLMNLVIKQKQLKEKISIPYLLFFVKIFFPWFCFTIITLILGTNLEIHWILAGSIYFELIQFLKELSFSRSKNNSNSNSSFID